MSERRRLCITKRACIALVLLLVALVGGAIVNVAVAWGCVDAMFPRELPNNGPWFTPHMRDLTWSEIAGLGQYGWTADSDRGAVISTSVNTFGAASETIQQEWMSRDGTIVFISPTYPSNTHVVTRVFAGYPCRSVSGEEWTDCRTADDAAIDRNRILSGLWRYERAVKYGRTSIPVGLTMPFRPIWPGFAINTVFYAFILWLLFAAPFALRRLRGGRRIKRGLCPKCAYPRGAGTNQVCTECGAAVASNVVH